MTLHYRNFDFQVTSDAKIQQIDFRVSSSSLNSENTGKPA